MGPETRNALASLIAVAAMTSPIGAAPAEPSANTPPTRSAAACPADDHLAADDVRGGPASAALQERLEQWRAQRARTLFSLIETRHADGSVSVDPQNLFATEIVMRRNADGSISIQCLPPGWRTLAVPHPAAAPLETK